MAELATSGGLPHLEIEERGGCVTVRFRHPDFVAPRPNGNDLIERQQAILAMLERSEDGLPLRAIHARLPLQVSEHQVRQALAELQDRGQVYPQGPAPRRAGNVFAAAKEEFDPKGSNWGQLGVRLLTGWAGGITLN